MHWSPTCRWRRAYGSLWTRAWSACCWVSTIFGRWVLRDSNEFSIIFVHGLQGHPRRTWYQEIAAPSVNSKEEKVQQNARNSRTDNHRLIRKWQSVGNRIDGGVFWPADLLPQDCPQARIVTFGYDSKITKLFRDAVNQCNVFGHARNLLYGLNRIRSDCVCIPHVYLWLLWGTTNSEIAWSTFDICCAFSWWYDSLAIMLLYRPAKYWMILFEYRHNSQRSRLPSGLHFLCKIVLQSNRYYVALEMTKIL